MPPSVLLGSDAARGFLGSLGSLLSLPGLSQVANHLLNQPAEVDEAANRRRPLTPPTHRHRRPRARNEC